MNIFYYLNIIKSIHHYHTFGNHLIYTNLHYTAADLMQYTKSTSSAFNYIFNIIQVHPFIKQFIERVNTTRISYISNTNYAIIIIIMIMAQPKHRLILLGRIIMSHHHEHICTRINCTGNPSSGSAFALIYFSHLPYTCRNLHHANK